MSEDQGFVGDMDIASLLVNKERCLMRAPLTDAVRSPSGVASLGMLITMVDVGASDPALAACRPDWTATQDLSMHGASWITEGPILVDNQLVRVGKKLIVVRADVYDGRGVEDFDAIEAAIDAGEVPLAARSLVTFARLPGAAARDADDYNPANWVGDIRHRPWDRPPAGTMYERMGLRVLDAAGGRVELDRTPYVANSIGTINGGAQAVMIETAAEAMRPGLAASDMQLHFLSQVKAGPAQSRGRVVREAGDHSVVDIDLVDAGNGDQLLTMATVTLRRPPS